MKVSVIIPAYNEEKFIGEAVDSALSQTYKDVEIVIVNDGSTDGTKRVLEPYISSGKVRCIDGEHRGLPSARNTGVKNARGDLLAFLDADDIFLPRKIEEQVDYFLHHPDCDVLYCGLYHFFDGKPDEFLRLQYRYHEGKDVLPKMLKYSFIAPSTVMIKKDAFKRFGYFDEKIRVAEDLDFWLRLAYGGAVFRFLDEPLLKFRLRRSGNLQEIARQPEVKLMALAGLKNLYENMSESDRVFYRMRQALMRANLKVAFAYILNGNKEKARQFIFRSFALYGRGHDLGALAWFPLAIIPAAPLREMAKTAYSFRRRLSYKKIGTPPLTGSSFAPRQNFLSEKLKKLHLGCQEDYLKGYVNIDLPPEAHTTAVVRADVYADVRDLSFEHASIAEVRAHHLLEHFSRQEALVLLSRFHKWLVVGGEVFLETPDFEEAAKKFIGANVDDQFVLARHVFGSQEASWAYHSDFWSEAKFRYVLGELGFGEFRFEKFSNNLEQKIPALKSARISRAEPLLKKMGRFGFNALPNIVCHAKKVKERVDYETAIRRILAKSLVGREAKILAVWMKDVHGKI